MTDQYSAWKVTRATAILTERTGPCGSVFIEGHVWTPKGIVTVDAGRYGDGDTYLSLRFIHRGLYTERVRTFSKLALARRAAKWAKEIAG